MKDRIDDWLMLAGVILMGWAQFGFPAQPEATFALGVGVAAKPMFLICREIHRDAIKKIRAR